MIDVDELQGQSERTRNAQACDALLGRLFQYHPDLAPARKPERPITRHEPEIIALAIPAIAEPSSPPRWVPTAADEMAWSLEICGVGQHRAKPRLKDIISACATEFGVTATDILSERRTQNVVQPRQAVMYLAKVMTLKSFPEIGRKLGGRDHTTALHGFRKIEKAISVDACLASRIARVQTMLRASL